MKNSFPNGAIRDSTFAPNPAFNRYFPLSEKFFFEFGSPTSRPKQKVAASGGGVFRRMHVRGFFHPTHGAKVWSLMICEAKKNVQPRLRGQRKDSKNRPLEFGVSYFMTTWL